MLEICTLGGLTIRRDGAPLTELTSRKVEALLVYLACTGQPHAREVLAELLWEGRSQERAQGNLRVALTSLRKHLGPYLTITRQTVALNPEAGIRVDALEFERLVTERPEAALELYRGVFLEGFYLRDAAELEQWIVQERERLQRVVVMALHRLVDADAEAGRWELGLAFAGQLLGLDPLDEAAHRQMMRLLACSDQRAAALAQYEACRRILDEELGVEPAAETVRLYEQIRDGELEVPAVKRPVPGPPAFVVGEVEPDAYQPPVFVARERELAWLEGLLERALAGQGRVVFVSGGPGRGKTALLDAFARQGMVDHPDLLVASGNCNAYSGVGDPYLPFRDVMTMLTGDVEGRWQAGAISGDHARRLWAALPVTARALLGHGPHLVPGLLRGGPLLSRARSAAPQGADWVQELEGRIERQHERSEGLEQSQLFQQATNMLRALAGTQPLLLILDDLQWADAASLGLLFHLGRRLSGSRILVAGAYRPEEVALGRQGERHPLEKVLAEFRRTYGDVCLDLTEEKEGEGRHFVGALLETESHRLEAAFEEALYRHACGHPLFTIELLRAMQERGDLQQDETGQWVTGPTLDWAALPARVEAVIEERIGRLEEDLRQILDVASVEGEEFTAQVVARVQNIDERELLGRLSRDLEQRHRLVRGRGVPQAGALRLSRYRFAHALFQQYLYDSLEPGERQLLHGEIATALEALYEGQEEVVAVQLAHHYDCAGDDRRALAYLTLAADGALATYANGEAEGYYRRALDLARSDSERAHLLAGLGEALRGQSRCQEAIRAWGEGIDLYGALDDSDGLARLYARSSRAAFAANDPREALRLCLEGLARVEGAPDSPGLARLLADVAGAHAFMAVREKIRPFVRQAFEMAERLGDVEMQAYALAFWGAAHFPVEDAVDALNRAVDLAESNGLIRTGARAHNNLGLVYGVWVGDNRAAQKHYRRAAELCGQAGNTTGQIRHLGNLAGNLTDCGDFEAAETTISQMHVLLKDLPEDTRAMILPLMVESFFLRRRGEWKDSIQLARAKQASARERGDDLGLANAGLDLAWAVLESRRLGAEAPTGTWEEAEEALTEAIVILDRSGYRANGMEARVCLGGLHVLHGRLGDARDLLADARQKDTAYSKGWFWVSTEALLQSLAGQIACAEGRWKEAVAALKAATDDLAHYGFRWYWVRSHLDLADVYTARGQPGDRERARELLGESLAMFREMGAPGYEAAIEARLRALSGEADSADGIPPG